MGPFDGIVVDAETERPIAGATVFGSWAFERGVGLTGPFGAETTWVETDADGRYALPKVGAETALPGGPSTRLGRFTLVVYRRGYVAWRSDRVFPDGATRRDFSQRRNRVRLESWADGASHVRHLVFMGGGTVIQRAAAWERQPAALELEGRQAAAALPESERATAGGPALLDASGLLSEGELRAVTGYAGKLAVGRLGDLPRTEFYDTIHFRAAEQPERYDVALRVWRLGEAAAAAQYREVTGALPAPEATDEIGDRSVRVATADVRAVAFLVLDPGLVVSVTCGIGQCPDVEQIVKLAKLVEGRLGELPARPTVEGTSTPEADGVADPFRDDGDRDADGDGEKGASP